MSLKSLALALLTLHCVLASAWASHAEGLAASDWISTGPDCKLFAVGDVDQDGYPDVLTVNGNRHLCWAPSVHGWKSAGWRTLVADVNPDATRMAVVHANAETRVVVQEAERMVVIPLEAGGKPGTPILVAADQQAEFTALAQLLDAHATKPGTLAERLTPPPYDCDAVSLWALESMHVKNRGRIAWRVFSSNAPHQHRVVRMAILESADPADSDADGLTDAEEAVLLTDPLNRDTDDDGLLDGWEVHGLPADRVKSIGPRLTLYRADCAEPDLQLNPRRKDVIVNVSYFDQVDRAAFAKEIPRAQAAYRGMHVANPDGTSGVWLHVRDIEQGVNASDQRMPWWDVGNKHFAKQERGLMHWMQVTPWGGGQSSETGDMGGSGNGWAVFVHELGHQLSLSHTGDSSPGWCPLYPSLMNYAYSYSFDGDSSKPHFSSGEFRQVQLDESHLREHLPFAYERVKFLANHPFRFTLKDNGDGTTLVDWNHNGVFDTEEVIADINYGGSTQAGVRKTHSLIGSAPSVASIAGKCFIAASKHKQTDTVVSMHKGNEEWTTPTDVPSSASRADPVLIGGPEFGVLLVRRFDAWAVGTVRPGAEPDSPPVVSALTTLPGVVAADLSGVRIGERILLLARHDTGATSVRWLALAGALDAKPQITEPKLLSLVASVPPGMVVNPSDGTITVVSSATHPKHGAFSLQVSTLSVNGDDITETPAEFTHGKGHSHCTSRPVAVYPNAGGKPQLTIFHTGWVDGNGLWTGWRTQRVENKSLDGGWLTSQLYDEWTRSRVALGFADSPDGAFYAFRWDSGDHHDWKTNTMFVAKGGYGIDPQPMRDFNDGAKVGLWGIRHSILTMPTDAELKGAR